MISCMTVFASLSAFILVLTSCILSQWIFHSEIWNTGLFDAGWLHTWKYDPRKTKTRYAKRIVLAAMNSPLNTKHGQMTLQVA